MAIITSGTATLESILSYTPCVTLYKTNLVSYLIIKPLLSIDFFSLPNLISGKHILPELLQGNISTEAILESIKYIEQQGTTFFNNECQEISNQLKAGGAEKAASKILELLNC
jgi:lipid-A-disaccharide synthase